jgi:hypothetical protein
MSRTACRGCGQPIRWAHSCDGTPVPLNPNPDPAGRLAYVATARGWRVRTFPPGTLNSLAAAERWRPHADTCPRLAAARSPR